MSKGDRERERKGRRYKRVEQSGEERTAAQSEEVWEQAGLVSDSAEC